MGWGRGRAIPRGLIRKLRLWCDLSFLPWSTALLLVVSKWRRLKWEGWAGTRASTNKNAGRANSAWLLTIPAHTGEPAGLPTPSRGGSSGPWEPCPCQGGGCPAQAFPP